MGGLAASRKAGKYFLGRKNTSKTGKFLYVVKLPSKIMKKTEE